MKNIQDIRQDYTQSTLDDKDVFEQPIRQFEKWLNDALEAKVEEPTAMTLATINENGSPEARIVLLKGVDEKGFRFFTNYDSAKGKNIANNNKVALVFFWKKLERQVRILGEAYPLSEEESLAYFQSRPKGSQIGAWASPQSQKIEDRGLLEANVAALEEQYADQEVLPKPPHWGGYIVRPYQIEFWQGRSSRLHDRISYTLTKLEPTEWTIERLAP